MCGLKWSTDGRHLASGGNDNLVAVWDNNMNHESTPLHAFREHRAAVKAVSWCPWQSNIVGICLASFFLTTSPFEGRNKNGESVLKEVIKKTLCLGKQDSIRAIIKIFIHVIFANIITFYLIFIFIISFVIHFIINVNNFMI